MSKMPHPSKDHRQPQPVRGFDDFGIVYGASGLNGWLWLHSGNFLYAIGKGKEGSDAATVPLSGSTAFIAPILQESTRLIWPAPTPTVCPSRA